ncbi:MAG: pyridoxal-dependent decarboxylase [Bacteroidales bacterium]
MKPECKFAIDALFLGPKAENAEFLSKTLQDFISDHFYWRKDYHPEDTPIISLHEQKTPEFIEVQQRTINALQLLSAKLRETSVPWHSPRYLGQMNSEILMPSIIGYVTAMLYNPNNCAYEGAPATTPMELDVGIDFCKILGFDPQKGWGHIANDGTIANMEGLWYARNLTSIPFAVKEVCPELVADKSDWELSNMKICQILDLADKVQDKWEDIRNHSVRGKGCNSGQLGKWIVPQTKHYSWVKAVDLLGIGIDNMIDVQVDDKYRMDMAVLEKTILDLVDKKIPILGVVAVIGTTEEGAVDHLDQVVALREKLEKEKGVSFYIHADAAYGGYVRTIFLDENQNFMPFDSLKTRLVQDGIFEEDINWPTQDIYNAYKSLADVNSITIDPHKMGYVPYAAGGIAIRDKRMVRAVSFFAAYVFEKNTSAPELLGSYIIEGSKAGAAAAGVWVAHQVIPLNITGYGRLIGASIYGAHKFYQLIKQTQPFKIGNYTIKMEALTEPDFNMVDWAYNIDGNTDLAKMNALNEALFDMSAPFGQPILKSDFLTSHTDLASGDYGDAPKEFTQRLGIAPSEWDRVKNVVVLRACLLTPYFMNPNVLNTYWDDFMSSMQSKIEKLFKQEELKELSDILNADKMI